MIYTISSGLDTVTEQLTDSTLREYVIDGLLPERDYTIAVRGYYQLLGPAGTTTVRLEGIIENWLTVEPDTIACTCIILYNRSYTIRVNSVTLLYLDILFYFLREHIDVVSYSKKS